MAMATNVGSFLAVVVLFMTLANASVHRVGGAAGWNSGVNYKAWASSNPIVLGDTLMFYYNGNYHDVHYVSKQDFDSCTTSNPISSDKSGSTYFVPLTVGKTYVICGTPGHCEKGMKLEVNTLGYSGYVPSPSIPTYGYGQPKGSAAHRFSSAGSSALTFALIMLAAI